MNWTVYFFGLTFVLHLIFAPGVFSAARGLRARGESVMFAPPTVWAMLTLLWGMLALLPYWLIHHSSLRKGRKSIVGVPRGQNS
jgi:membrane protein implicated in regulation of membrane protease activity